MQQCYVGNTSICNSAPIDFLFIARMMTDQSIDGIKYLYKCRSAWLFTPVFVIAFTRSLEVRFHWHFYNHTLLCYFVFPSFL